MTTKSRGILLILVLFVMGAGLVHAQESGRSGPEIPLKAEMTGQIMGSVYRLYLAADPSVVWKPGLFAVGIGMEAMIGLNMFDVYLLPYLRFELGWFHLDIGYGLAVVESPSGDEVGGFSLGLAVAPKPFKVGYGRLGFDLGLDFNVPGYRSGLELLTDEPPARKILGAALLSGRFGIGVSYSFQLL